jgi:hypothetical protein
MACLDRLGERAVALADEAGGAAGAAEAARAADAVQVVDGRAGEVDHHHVLHLRTHMSARGAAAQQGTRAMVVSRPRAAASVHTAMAVSFLRNSFQLAARRCPRTGQHQQTCPEKQDGARRAGCRRGSTRC